MPEGNRLVDEAAAAVEADRSMFTGAGMLQDAVDLGRKVGSGDWTEGLVSLASAAYDTRDLLADPIAKLASMGLGWLIEHFAPFAAVLDMLTGDQERLALMVETWSGIAEELHGAAQELHDHYTTDTAGWTGPAVAQYRLFCADRVDLYHAAGATAQATADNVACCRSILSGVREVVRGLVTDAVGSVVSIVCRYPPPTTPAAVGEVSQKLVSTGNEVRQWLDTLQRAFANAGRLMKDGGNLFADVRLALVRSNNPGLATGVRAVAKSAARDAFREMPDQLVEKIAVETGKESVKAAAQQADKPARPGDPSRLYDGPGPYRVIGTL